MNFEPVKGMIFMDELEFTVKKGKTSEYEKIIQKYWWWCFRVHCHDIEVQLINSDDLRIKIE